MGNSEGKYDILNKQFLSKAAIVGLEVKTERLPSGKYRLIYLDTKGDTIQIPSFIAQIKDNALLSCSNLKKLILPDLLTSLEVSLYCPLEEINIPKNVAAINNLVGNGYTNTLKVTIEGRRKSVRSGAYINLNNLSIINSQLIKSINKLGFNGIGYIDELRLIDTKLDSRAIKKCRIGNLFICAYTNIEVDSFIDCKVDNLHYIVDTQEKAEQSMAIARSSTDKYRFIQGCEVGNFNIRVVPNLSDYIS